QPYARPRTEELTGTAASLPSAELPRPAATVPPSGLAPQAAGPPSQTVRTVPVQVPRPAVVDRQAQITSETPPPTATTGRSQPQGAGCSCSAPPVEIYIDYQGQRWYARGGPQPLDPATQEKIGTYHGFDVWANRDDGRIIYIPVTVGSSSAVAYSRTRPSERIRWRDGIESGRYRPGLRVAQSSRRHGQAVGLQREKERCAGFSSAGLHTRLCDADEFLRIGPSDVRIQRYSRSRCQRRSPTRENSLGEGDWSAVVR